MFTRPSFCHMRTLVYGTLLASGRRTVTAALRAMGRGDERHFTTFHRVLNRAVWSPFHVSRILLGLLVMAFLTPDAPLSCSSMAPWNADGDGASPPGVASMIRSETRTRYNQRRDPLGVPDIRNMPPQLKPYPHIIEVSSLSYLSGSLISVENRNFQVYFFQYWPYSSQLPHN